MNEFSIIDKYFNWDNDSTVSVGVGDDCAVINLNSDYQIVTSVDTLIQGVHFSSSTRASDVAYKALAVNLSDLAAMGAIPRFFTLSLSFPELDEVWLSEFSNSLKDLSEKYSINLVGGDTTRGPLSITINVTGEIERGCSIMRSGAKVGDLVYISNTVGDAAYAWKQIQGNGSVSSSAISRLNRPTPRIELGRSLVGIARSCIDISDGLEQDLCHILDSSSVGATIDIDRLPLSDEVRSYIKDSGDWCIALSGGDDYELCFSVDKKHSHKIKDIEERAQIKLTEVGIITASRGLIVNGFNAECQSYQHF